MAGCNPELDRAQRERDELKRLRESVLGRYYNSEEWAEVGLRAKRKGRLFPLVGKSIGDRSAETLVDAALLQLAPENQRSWRRVLFMAEAAIQSHLGRQPDELGESVLSVANSMPVKELALEDDPQEAPFIQTYLFPWGPIPIINGMRSHQAAIYAQVSRALGAAIAPGMALAKGLDKLHFGYCLLQHIANTAQLPEYLNPVYDDFENRDVEHPEGDRLRTAVMLSDLEWSELLASCKLQVEDVAGLVYESASAPDSTWHFLDYPCNYRPVVKTEGGYVVVNVAALPFAALHLLWDGLDSNEQETLTNHVCRGLGSELETFFERMGNDVLWHGKDGLVVGCDSSSALIVLPIVDVARHPRPEPASLDERAKACLDHLPASIVRFAVVLVDASLCRPSFVLQRGTLGEAFVGHATLNYEMMYPLYDQVGRDSMFLLYYATDLLVFTNHFTGWETMDPPEIMADYVLRRGFPLPEPTLAPHLVQVITAGHMHNESERRSRRRYFVHPHDKKWCTAVSNGRDQEHGIYRNQDDPQEVILTHMPKPLWVTLAGDGSGELHELAPGIQDALCYWLARWREKIADAPAWQSLPDEGALLLLVVTAECLIMDPREWTETNRPPHASVGKMSNTNMLAGVVQLGSSDFLAKRVNDYEHFLSTEFLYGLRLAMGLKNDGENLIEYTIESQKSPFERRLLAGITSVGHALTPVPDAPQFARWSNQNYKQLKAAVLLHLYSKGAPTEVAPKEAPDVLQDLHGDLLHHLVQTLDHLGPDNVLFSAYTMVEGMMAERERAKVFLTARAVNEEKLHFAYRAAQEAVDFVDRRITSARWLVHAASKQAHCTGTMLPTSDLDLLLHLADLCLEVGVLREAYTEKQEKTPYVLHGEHAFQSKGGDYTRALRDGATLFEAKESRWGKERIKEYWPEPEHTDGAAENPAPLFASAFHDEFGVTYDDFMRGMAALVAVIGDSPAVTTEDWTSLTKRASDRASITVEIIERVAKAFTQREQFDRGLAGTPGPWRPLLPNSLLRRPIVRLKNGEACVGTRLFDASCYQFIHLCSEGSYPAESIPMERAMQKARQRHAKEFERAVAAYITSQPGWIAKADFPPGSFGAPDELGDFDVLAWHFTGHLVAIECKAYTITTGPRRLASEWKELSKGSSGKPGTLGKHRRRIDWLSKNLEIVGRTLDWYLDNAQLHGIVVTQKHSPTRIWKKDQMLVLAFDELQMCIEDGLEPADWRTAAEQLNEIERHS